MNPKYWYADLDEKFIGEFICTIKFLDSGRSINDKDVQNSINWLQNWWNKENEKHQYIYFGVRMCFGDIFRTERLQRLYNKFVISLIYTKDTVADFFVKFKLKGESYD